MKHLAVWLGTMGLLALFVALRWNSISIPLVRDEGEYAYAARILAKGMAPYEHSFLQKPPMVIYSYALAHLVAPGRFWSPRVLACVFVALATALLGLVAWLEFGPGVAWPAMWLMTPMVLLPGIEQFTANTEMFMLLPLMGTVALYVLGRNNSRLWAVWLGAGVLAATTFWYKYTALPVLLAIFTAWLLRDWRAKKSRLQMARDLCFGLAGAAVASLMALGFFLFRDSGKHLWECTVVFNRYYSGSSTFDLAGVLGYLRNFWVHWWVIFLLLPALAIRPARNLLAYVGIFMAAWVATGSSVYGHYYIILMPFWALLSAVAINQLSVVAADKLRWSQAWFRRALVMIVLALLCVPQWPWMVRSRQQFATDKLGGVSPFIESVPAAQQIQELTRSNDYVFVAGSEPQILCYANRQSSTRFVIAYPMMIPTPVARPYQLEAILELEQHPPAVIAIMISNTSWLTQPGSPRDLFEYIDQLVAKHYERVGGYIVEGKERRWAAPLADQDVPRTSMILMKRKAF